MPDKENIRTIDIDELTPDPKNANQGTVRGRKALSGSLKKLGTGRSILVDKNLQTLAGNKTLDEAKKLGHKKIIVVDADGDTLIAVRRTDLDAKDKKAQQLAIADNRVSELDLNWDPDVLKETEADLTELFDPRELDIMLNEGKNSKQPNTIELQDPPKMLWILLGVPMNRFDVVQEHLTALESEAEISVQTARNE
jgi:hypothetical protein